METRHWIVKGRVQGVGFRFSTVEVARKLALVGWVRNLTTGEVEVLASGERDALDELGNWLNRGPSSARVSEAVTNRVSSRELTGFRELPDADWPESFERA
jgi:acylphosphatase